MMIGLRGQTLQGLLCLACSLFLFSVAVADQDSGAVAAVAQGPKKDPTAAAQVKKKQSPAASQDSAPTKVASSGRFAGKSTASTPPAPTSKLPPPPPAPKSPPPPPPPAPKVPMAPPPPPPPPASAQKKSTTTSSMSFADQLAAGKKSLTPPPVPVAPPPPPPPAPKVISSSSSPSTANQSAFTKQLQAGAAALRPVGSTPQATSGAGFSTSSATKPIISGISNAVSGAATNMAATGKGMFNSVKTTGQSIAQSAKDTAEKAKALAAPKKTSGWGSWTAGMKSIGTGLQSTMAVMGSNPMFQQLSALAVGSLVSKTGANKDMVDLAMATTMSATGTAALGGNWKDFSKNLATAPVVQQNLAKVVGNVAAKIDPRLEQMAFNATLKGVNAYSTSVDDGKGWKESLKDFVVEKGVTLATEFVAKQFPNNPELATVAGDLIKIAATGDKDLLLTTAKQAALDQGMKLMIKKLGGRFGDNSQDMLELMEAAAQGQDAFKERLVRMAQEKGKDNVLKLVAAQMGPEAAQIASIFIDAGMQGKDALVTAGQELAMAKGQELLLKTMGDNFGGAEAIQFMNALTAGPDAVKALIKDMGVQKVMILAQQVGGDELAQMVAVLAEAEGVEGLSTELQHIALAKTQQLATESIGMDVAVLAQAVKSNDPEVLKLETEKLTMKYGAEFTKRAMTDLGGDELLGRVNTVVDQVNTLKTAVEQKEAEIMSAASRAAADAEALAQKAQADAEQKVADAKRAAQERLDAAKLKTEQVKQATAKRIEDAKKLAEQKKADEELRKMEEEARRLEAEALAADELVAQEQAALDQQVVEDKPVVATVVRPLPIRPGGIGASIIAGKLNPQKVVDSLNKKDVNSVAAAVQGDGVVDVSAVKPPVSKVPVAEKKPTDRGAAEKKAAADKAAQEKQAADDAAAKAAAVVREKRLKAIAANLASFLREYSIKAAEQLKATAFNDQILDLTIPVILDATTNDTVNVGMVYDLGFGGFGSVLEQPFATVTGVMQPVMLQLDDEQLAVDQAFLQQYLPAPAYKLLDQLQQLTPQQVFLIKVMQLCSDAQNLAGNEQQDFMTAGLTLLFSRLTSTVDAAASDDSNTVYISGVTDLFKDLPPFLQAAVKGITMPVSEAQKLFFEDHQSAAASKVAQLVGQIRWAEGYNVRTAMLGNDLIKLIKPTLSVSDKALILTAVNLHITDYNKGFVADDNDDFVSEMVNERLAQLKPVLIKAVAAMKKAGCAAVDGEAMAEISGFSDDIDNLINAEFIDDLPNYQLPCGVVAGKRDAMAQEPLARYLQIMFAYVMRNVVERVFNSRDGAPYMDNALDQTSSFEELLALFVRGIRDRDYPDADIDGLLNDELPSWYGRSGLDGAGYDALYKKIDTLTGALKLPSDLFEPIMRNIDVLAEEANGMREDALMDNAPADNAAAA